MFLYFKYYLLATLISIMPWLLSAQENCKVLVPQISGQYVGKCKKGLAHGEGLAIGTDQYEGEFKKGLPHGFGEYKFATGEVYKGEWNKGFKDGIGEFIIIDSINNQTITYKGIWNDDLFIGPEINEPIVTAIKTISRHEFHKTGEGRSVNITIYSGAALNENIYYGYCHSTSGSHYYSPAKIKIEMVNFPVTCEIHYRGYDQLSGNLKESFIKFDIPEPGNWTVNLYNN